MPHWNMNAAFLDSRQQVMPAFTTPAGGNQLMGSAGNVGFGASLYSNFNVAGGPLSSGPMYGIGLSDNQPYPGQLGGQQSSSSAAQGLPRPPQAPRAKAFRFCHGCGAEARPSYRFCPFCRTCLDEDEEDDYDHSTPPVQMEPAVHQAPQQQRTSGSVRHVLDNLGSMQYVQADANDLQRARVALLRHFGLFEEST